MSSYMGDAPRRDLQTGVVNPIPKEEPHVASWLDNLIKGAQNAVAGTLDMVTLDTLDFDNSRSGGGFIDITPSPSRTSSNLSGADGSININGSSFPIGVPFSMTTPSGKVRKYIIVRYRPGKSRSISNTVRSLRGQVRTLRSENTTLRIVAKR